MCASSGARIGDSAKSVSLVPGVGVHAGGIVPFAENITMKRLAGAAAACARRGSIASSQGRAIAAPPAPRRIVRRDRGRVVCCAHGEASGGRLRNAAMRTVARTICLKSPLPRVPVNAVASLSTAQRSPADCSARPNA